MGKKYYGGNLRFVKPIQDDTKKWVKLGDSPKYKRTNKYGHASKTKHISTTAVSIDSYPSLVKLKSFIIFLKESNIKVIQNSFYKEKDLFVNEEVYLVYDPHKNLITKTYKLPNLDVRIKLYKERGGLVIRIFYDEIDKETFTVKNSEYSDTNILPPFDLNKCKKILDEIRTSK